MGHLVAVSDEYWKMCTEHLNLFAKKYPTIRYEYEVVGKLQNFIIENTERTYPTWFSHPCREHRIFCLRKLLISRVTRGLKWSSLDQREQKKRTKAAHLGASKVNAALKKFRFQ